MENWALELERRKTKAEGVLGTVHKVFQSTASAVLTPELRSLKRIIEKFMTVTEREQRKDTLAKAQLATTKASQGLNRVNELETENTVLRRKINELFKTLSSAKKKMMDMKPKKSENERLNELLQGTFDFDEDYDEVVEREEDLALDAIDRTKKAAIQANLLTKRCHTCGCQYLVDGGNRKSTWYSRDFAAHKGDSYLKTYQDLELAKAQLKAFKVNLKHLRIENTRFRSAIEYLKTKLQLNKIDINADLGAASGNAVAA